MPIPEPTTIRAAKILVKNRDKGLMSLISSQTPTTRLTRAANKIPKRCLSKGKSSKEVTVMATKMGIPPPRGTGETAVALWERNYQKSF